MGCEPSTPVLTLITEMKSFLPISFLLFFSILVAIASSSNLETTESSSSAATPALTPEALAIEEFLKLIFAFCINDPKIRLVSKMFKSTFDDACKYSVMSYDPRLRYLIEAEQSNDIQRIPFQVPLSFLLRDFFGEALAAIRNDLNSKFPLIMVPQTDKRLARIKKRAMKKNTERFLYFLSHYIQITFHNPQVPDSERLEPQKLFNFYILIRALFPTKDFIAEIIPTFQFPIIELLGHAARGAFQGTVNAELLMEFQHFIQPNLIFETFKTSNLHLTALILNTNNAERFARARDQCNRRPMHYAAHFGDIPLMEKIISLVGKKQLTIVDQKNEKPIHKAAASGHLAAVSWLYNEGSIVNKAGYTKPPILKAVVNNHFYVVDYLLNKTNFNSVADADFSMNLIKAAIKNNDREMLSLLRNSRKLHLNEDQIRELVQLSQREDMRIGRILNPI